MSPPEERPKRRYLPAEAYRLLALAALAGRGGRPASKGELAWETRANHYMITRVVGELAAQGHVRLERRAEDGAYVIGLTEEGRAFHERHRDYLARSFGRALAERYRYGRAPAWLPRDALEPPS